MILIAVFPSPAGPQTLPEAGLRANLQNARLTRVLDQRVEDSDGERLGAVRNLVLDSSAGRVKYVIVSGFGLPGLSPRRIVPAEALSTATTKRDTLALNVSKARWEKAPRFKGDLVQLGQPGTARAISEFYFPTARASSKEPSASGPGHVTPKTSRSRHQAAATPPTEGLQLASDLLSREVADSRQKSVGHIADLLVDLAGAKPTIAILSTSTLFSKGANYAVPLSLLVPVGPELKLEVTRARLSQAQLFTPQAWSLAQNTSSATIYRLDGATGFK